MRKKVYDLIVIGTGSTGATAAGIAREKGWKVAIIDSRNYGGTCAQRGCDPKKVLYGFAKHIEQTKNFSELKGVSGELEIDWKKLMKFKNTFTESVPKNSEKSFRKSGIKTYHGKAYFIGKNKIQFKGKELEAKHFAIAAGSSPRILKIPGEEHVILSDEFLNLKELPKEIIFIGGGFVSFELAHIAAAAGSKVKILHRSEQPLKQFDSDLVKNLMKDFKERGIEIILNTPVDSVENKKGKLIVKSGKKKFTADLAVHGAGRVPHIKNLGLKKAGVKYSDKGIKTNKSMQTSNEKIYAGGDCAEQGFPLTPVAGMHGRIIGNNLTNRNKMKFDDTATASVLFTYPPLASVGLTEHQAKEKKIKYNAEFIDTSSWFNSRRLGIKYSCAKILKDKEGKLIGAHLYYPNADESINIFAMMIKNNISSEEIKNHLLAYPTSSYDIKYMI